MRLRSLLTCAALAAGSFYTPDASACGGCFPPQGEQASIVTDHRMVMTVSTSQSTLYDQIRYQGSPSEFAWILPISGTVDVGISADSLFAGLDTLTSLVVQEPPRNCPTFGSDCYDGRSEDAQGSPAFGGSSASSGSGGPALDGGATVLKQEVVGPYETVQLKPGTDPQSVYTWLTTNKFNLTDDIKPIIAYYTSKSFNFLALKLKPGTNDVKSMRPIRVTSPNAGGATSLPLKMVAAGTGATTGITLWVVSNGRYEPTNFDSFLIKDEEITWDWNTGASNYKDLRAKKQDGGKAWEVESAITSFPGAIDNAARSQASQTGNYTEGGDYLKTATKSAEEVRTDDFEILQKGLGNGDLHITRLRADLARAALANDLTIGAAADQTDIPRTRQPKLENGQPLCQVIQNCRYTGESLPRDQAYAKSTGSLSSTSSGTISSSGTNPNGATGGNSSDGTFTCRTSVPRSNPGVSIAFAFLALTLGRAIRKRRS